MEIRLFNVGNSTKILGISIWHMSDGQAHGSLILILVFLQIGEYEQTIGTCLVFTEEGEFSGILVM